MQCRLVLLAALVQCSDAFAPSQAHAHRLAQSLAPPICKSSSSALSMPHRPRAAQPTAMARLGGGGFGGGGGFDPRSLVGPVVFVSLIASGALGWIFNGILFLSVIPLFAGPLVNWCVRTLPCFVVHVRAYMPLLRMLTCAGTCRTTSSKARAPSAADLCRCDT